MLDTLKSVYPFVQIHNPSSPGITEYRYQQFEFLSEERDRTECMNSSIDLIPNNDSNA
jgi:hypothetical protein